MAEQTRLFMEEVEKEMPGYQSPENESASTPRKDHFIGETRPFFGTPTFWRIALIVLAIYGGAWLIQMNFASRMRGILLLIGAAAVIVLPVAAGIWFGLRLVERDRRRTANLLGIILLAGGSALFAFVASKNKDGYWRTIEGGKFIGSIGTYLGLCILLFGLGMLKRNSSHPRRD